MKKVELRTPAELETSLYRHLKQRQLPDCFLYIGESGAKNWTSLEQSEDFPVASRLTELLRGDADTIAETVPESGDLVSVGTGNGRKERLLLEAMLPDWNGRYVAIDVSSGLVDEALETVDDLEVDATGCVAFCGDLPQLREHWDSSFLLCLLGNNFCNYHPGELLDELRSELGPGDLLLFDAHLQPRDAAEEDQWRQRIQEAYGSEQNARFNLWPLIEHGAATDACQFEIGLIRTETKAGTTYRTRKVIRVQKPTTLDFAGDRIELDADEVIEMGYTYKYTAEHLRSLLDAHGWKVIDEFQDGQTENILLLAGVR